jgi:alpha-ketoglutarate-dependent taurine dioxygenase
VKIDILPGPCSGIDAQALGRLVFEKGVVLIRNGSCRRDDFLRLSDAAGADFVCATGGGTGHIGGGYSGRNIVDGIPSLFTVTGKGFNHGVPLHGELYFQQADPPELLWFYCSVPPAAGGQTLVCDGQALFAALPGYLQRLLAGADLVYLRRMDAAVWPAYFGSGDAGEVAARRCSPGMEVTLNDDGSMTTRFRSPAVRMRCGVPVFINNLLPFALREIHTPAETRAQVRLGNGEALAAADVLEIERIAAPLTAMIDWQAGDILVVDNTRTLHGRAPVLDQQREIHVRLSHARIGPLPDPLPPLPGPLPRKRGRGSGRKRDP